MNDVQQVPPPRTAATSRAERVADAVEGWLDDLSDLGGRSTLLHFRDLKVGTLDLAAAEPEARKRLLDGQATPISRLFPHDPLRSSAMRSARAIRAKARELTDERGIQTCFLAVGVATWADPFAPRRPTAPVLLRPARVEARGAAASDYVVHLGGDPQVNPVLLHAMAAQLGLRIEPDDLLDPAGDLRYPVVVERMRELAPAHVVDGFSIAHRAVLGTFSWVDLPMVEDLRAAGGLLAAHDVVAAIAGDPQALEAVRGGDADPRGQTPDTVPPEREVLVLDADSAQSAAIDAAAAGRHLLVRGAPGTGKSQTIVNLVAALAASGQRVLVVSEKRAALDAVVGRLDRVGLSDLVLDLREGVGRRRDLVAGLVARLEPTLALAREPGAAGPQANAAGSRLVQHREALRRQRDTMHAPRPPWGVTAYQAQAAAAATPAEARTAARIDRRALARLDGERHRAARGGIREYADLGGLRIGPDTSPWHGARLSSPADARAARDLVLRLRDSGLTGLRDGATRAAIEVGLPAPRTPVEAFETVDLLGLVDSTLRVFSPAVWRSPVDDMVSATADRAWRRERDLHMGWFARRRLREVARGLLHDPASGGDRARLHAHLVEAAGRLARWRERARDGRPPAVGGHAAAALETAAAVRADLDALATVNPRAGDLVGLPFPDALRRLSELAGDERTLHKLPRLGELERSLGAAGLDPLLEDLRRRDADPATAVAAYDHARYTSLLESWRSQDPSYGAFDARAHDDAVEAYRDADVRHVSGAAARVRQAHARTVHGIWGDHPEQAARVAEAAAGTRQRSLRDLVRAAPDLLPALAPCWVMSPLVVPQVLPARRLFDVVVVDEASQVRPADAVPALLRADRVVVVGDECQLSPTAFFTAVTPGQREPEGDPAETAAVEPAESLVDALAGVLPTRSLTCHYRSRDERLVAFSNRRFYGGALTTFPGAVGGTVRNELVQGTATSADPIDSSTPEVERTVELVIAHARARPQESLGVVTLSARHADRVEAALRAVLRRLPGLDDFFREDREEPFFVKNVERVQGDVRDATVLSLGYGRAVDGRVLYRFGPLDQAGGEHRLNVAVTRARQRTTVVSSFRAEDLNERRLTTPGALALRDYLAYAAGSGDTAPVPGDSLDPLEAEVAVRLAEAGADVVPRHGSSGRRIGLAVRHPARPDRFVLAVDVDGPAYAADPTVRDRDRLFPEQLERLGWRVHRVWSADWLADPDGAAGRLVQAFLAAVQEADALDSAEAAAVADEVVGLPDEVVVASRGRSEQPAAVERSPRPRVARGRDVGAYALGELVAMVRWVESDGVLRTVDEVVGEVMAELGFRPPEPRAQRSLRHAVRVARAGAPVRLPLADPDDQAPGEAAPGEHVPGEQVPGRRNERIP